MEKGKRLLEEVSYSDVLLEDANVENGSEEAFLIMDMMVADEINANGRRYPLLEVESALIPFTKSVKEGLGTAIMLADHPPQGNKPSLKDAAGIITEIFLEGKVVKGKVKLLETDQGDNIHAIVKAGGRVGVSSRGLGKLVEIEEGEIKVQEVRNLVLKGFDFVVFPSLGSKSMSQELIYEDLKDDVCHLFPDLIKDIKELKEAVSAVKCRIDSDDVDVFKATLIEDLTRKPTSNVFINDTQNCQEQNLLKEDTDIMTLQEFQEKQPELYEELTKEVAEELIDKVKTEVIESITKDVTAKVTTEVTEAVTVSVKEAITKELTEAHEAEKAELQKQLDEANASIEETKTKLDESEKALEESRDSSQPYIDILEGLVDFMREKNLLIQESEVVKHASKEVTEDEENVELKKVQDEMSKVIEEQKAKLEEAVAKIGELEENRKVLEEAAEKAKIAMAVTDILAKEPKYASLLESKLQKAGSIEEVTTIYEAEKSFITEIEKLNESGREVPAGEATVTEEEEIKEETTEKKTVEESENIPQTIQSLREYQQKLAGLKI
jgi:hypothetical protein